MSASARFQDANRNKTIDANEVSSLKGVWNNSVDAGKIDWNPKRGMLDNEGNPHSPALVLEHEAAHAKHAIQDLDKYLQDVYSETTDGTSNLEERKTISEVNTVSANLNNGDGGNGKRVKHEGGETLQMLGPASTLIIERVRKLLGEIIPEDVRTRDNLGGAGDAADGLNRGNNGTQKKLEF